MGIWKKNLDEANTGPVNQAQSIIYRDRDFSDEHDSSKAVQLELPFGHVAAVPKITKTQYELKKETDEIFENFKTVLTGKDVDTPNKLRVLTTILNNFKTGNSDISNRSQALLLDLFSELTNEI